MNRLITILLLIGTICGKAAEKQHFTLFTDRDVYTSGENVLFNVFVPSIGESAMLNVYLINTKGKIISSVRKKISNEQVNGFVYLPDSLKTDTYLLCTSTRENPNITIKELFVCNRFNGLTETSTLRVKNVVPISEAPTEELLIEGISNNYRSRDKVHVSLHFTPALLSNMKNPLFLAVVESNQGFDSQTFSLKSNKINPDLIPNEEIILEGHASDLKTGAPFKNGRILLSVPDSIPWLNYYTTSDNGNFHFQMKDYFGKIPVVIQGVDADKKQLLKLTLNRIDSLSEALPLVEQRPISPVIQKDFENRSEATTLRKIFNCQEISVTNPPLVKRHEYAFYGAPTETVYPALFIDLPNFTEISREILPGVKFRAFNRIPTLQILNPVTLNYFVDPPLVTLDGVPVHDLNIIKNMGSNDIQRIEICRKERYYGDLVFPGVVAIYSNKTDYKRLTESDDLIKLEMEAIQPNSGVISPNNLKSNEPDLRKVFYWNPALKAESDVKVEFVTSDIKGTYQLVVKGLTKDGKVFMNVQNFEVK